MRRFVDFFRPKKGPEAEGAPPAYAGVETSAPEVPASVNAEPSPVETTSTTPAAEPAVAAASSDPPAEGIEAQVIGVLRDTFDPEIPVNIHELGLIYETRVDPAGAVYIKMTLTSPMCPVAGSLPPEVAAKVRALPGVTDVNVDLVWEPPWNPNMMSEAARLQLGMM